MPCATLDSKNYGSKFALILSSFFLASQLLEFRPHSLFVQLGTYDAAFQFDAQAETVQADTNITVSSGELNETLVSFNNTTNTTSQPTKRPTFAPTALPPPATTGLGQNQSSTPTPAYLAACLLIKDDNELLPEWLAYHYHLWNLRRVVVAIDPTSETSPRSIFQTWKDTLDSDNNKTSSYFPFDFVQWKDKDYLPNWFVKDKDYSRVPTTRMTTLEEKNPGRNFTDQEVQQISNHRFRQREFFRACIRHYTPKTKQARLPDWLMHIDTDEYVAWNPILRQNKTFAAKVQQQDWNRTLHAGAFMDALDQRWQAWQGDENKPSPCVSLPRLLFGGVDSSNPPTMEPWNRSTFHTLRWKYHAKLETGGPLNGNPKVFLHLPSLRNRPKALEELRTKVVSIHRPNAHLCPKTVSFSEEPLFAVHHYLGSLEGFLARTDARRSPEGYLIKANQTEGGRVNDWIDEWLPEFVNRHGLEIAAKLLEKHLLSTKDGNPSSDTK